MLYSLNGVTDAVVDHMSNVVLKGERGKRAYPSKQVLEVVSERLKH